MRIPQLRRSEQRLHISEVLNRRTDLSTFVVHLTRDHGGEDTAKNRLLAIIEERRLREGDQPRGWATGVKDQQTQQLALNDAQRETQKVVCFSETPLEHIYSMFASIQDRQIELEPYGLALTKMVARRAGVNPVWYVDITDAAPPHPWRIRTALNRLVVRSCREGWFDEVSDAFPSIEGMLTRRNEVGALTFQREFWWEREWRHIGDMSLALIWDKILWLCPETEINEIEAAVRRGNANAVPYVVDPNWGLERIIGKLMGLAEGDLTPFAPR
ncbi:MAG: hypothetical protein M3Q30_22370 [Actinomycetota bacterium]|nr:hypothetical protein [Actinomycetota bacterium]